VARFSTQTGTQLSFTDVAIAGVAQGLANGQLLTFDEEFRKMPGIRIP
jgi:predicted nucleic acid-binding protein